ncbi:MAG: hypothetical protein QOD92_1149 [Acidimicrobiaceae bacterium]
MWAIGVFATMVESLALGLFICARVVRQAGPHPDTARGQQS